MAGRKKATRKPTARKTAATRALDKAFRLLSRALTVVEDEMVIIRDLLRQKGTAAQASGNSLTALDKTGQPVEVPVKVMGPNGKIY